MYIALNAIDYCENGLHNCDQCLSSQTKLILEMTVIQVMCICMCMWFCTLIGTN